MKEELGANSRTIILRADEGVDRQDAVAAGSVLDHDRLIPFLGQPVRQ